MKTKKKARKRKVNTKAQLTMSEVRYLTPKELCKRFRNRVTEKTLANWRTNGTGPKFTRIGGRIAYPLHEVERWEQRNTVKHTGEYSSPR